MERELFERRLSQAATAARDFARQFISEELPDAMRFCVHLNRSYDLTASPEFTLYPDDSLAEMALRHRDVSAAQVVDLLWRVSAT